MELSLDEAEQFHSAYPIGTEHILLGLLAIPESGGLPHDGVLRRRLREGPRRPRRDLGAAQAHGVSGDSMTDRLVIFDCDGVLVDNEAVWKRIADEMAAELGFVLTGQDHERYRGVLDVDMYADLSRRFGVALPDDLMQRLQAVKVAASHTEITAVPGAAEAVTRVVETGVRTCVASNGTVEETVAKLTGAGLLGFFGDRIFSGCDVPQGKPAPDLFLEASRVMGVDVSRCIVVEDSDTGVQAALSAGMTTLDLAPNGPSPFVAGSGAVAFAGYAELTDELVRMCGDGMEVH